MEELIENQKFAFGIGDFLDSAKKYTFEVFPDLNLDNFFENLVSRKN